jgi:hypothetical protein
VDTESERETNTEKREKKREGMECTEVRRRKKGSLEGEEAFGEEPRGKGRRSRSEKKRAVA